MHPRTASGNCLVWCLPKIWWKSKTFTVLSGSLVVAPLLRSQNSVLLSRVGWGDPCMCTWPNPAPHHLLLFPPIYLHPWGHTPESLDHNRFPCYLCSKHWRWLWFSMNLWNHLSNLCIPSFTSHTAKCCRSHGFIPQCVSRRSLSVRQRVQYPEHVSIVYLDQNCTCAGWLSLCSMGIKGSWAQWTGGPFH